MQGLLIGEVLSQMGIISSQDINRIVAHQRETRQKFGQIAVRWGLVTQEQVWEAWARQFAQREHLDLDDIGTDTAAWRCVPITGALQFGIVPLRLWGNHLVVAAPSELPQSWLDEVARISNCHIHVCTADRETIRDHLETLLAASAA